MADTLSLKLKEHANWCALNGTREDAATCREAAAELDRREAIVAAAEAWAKAKRDWPDVPVVSTAAEQALLAILPAAALKG